MLSISRVTRTIHLYPLSPPLSSLQSPSRRFHRFSPQLLSTPSSSPPPIFQAIDTDVYPFGVPTNDRSKALFLSLNWTISSNDPEAWAILSISPPSSSSSSTLTSTSTTTARSNLVSTLLHQVRYDPIGSAKHPFLATTSETSLEDSIGFVSFKARLQNSSGGGGGSSGGFDDYTARYYSIREEDKLTLRQSLIQTSSSTGPSSSSSSELEELAELLKVKDLLDLPLITLSNGQTRRSRILKSLLKKPQLLILEEPFTGLDSKSRESLTRLLAKLHENSSPRILLVLRSQDVLPEFVTHLAVVVQQEQEQGSSGRQTGGPSTVKFGTREEILENEQVKEMFRRGESERLALKERKEKLLVRQKKATQNRGGEGGGGKVLIDLKDVNVVYGRDEKRTILKNVSWKIRRGEKWVLAGHNGSGKSTLLSIILGDHPKSFTEQVSIFDKPRYRQATCTIQEKIGHVSPEIFNSFPRKYGEQGLTVYDTIVTGFESIYSFRKPTEPQKLKIDALLSSFSDHPALSRRNRSEFLGKLFASLTPGEQAFVLLLRALVKQPELLILDEPFQGMDLETIRIVKKWLNDEDDYERKEQSIVLISHFEEEIPESFDRRLELENGIVKELI
ncbi:hypothetical protein JCM5350_001450 [Sporobolomyces pararoseus]